MAAGQQFKILFLRKNEYKYFKMAIENNKKPLKDYQKDQFEVWELENKRISKIKSIPEIFDLDYRASIKKYMYNKKHMYNSFYDEINSSISSNKRKKGNINIIKNLLWTSKKTFTLIARLIKISMTFKNRSKSVKIEFKKRILILFTHRNQYEFWKKVLNEFKNEEILFIIGYDKPKESTTELKALLIAEGYEFQEVDVSKFNTAPSLSEKIKILSFILRPLELDSWNEALEIKSKYIKNIIKSSQVLALMKALKPRVVLVNAYEVNNFAHLFCQIIRQCGGKVINTMNGIKNIDPRNNETNFDTWCIWSESQKKLLVKYNRLPPQQLIVTGHLQADTAEKYTYTGELEKTLSIPQNKKIVSIFSQPQILPGDYRNKFLQSINLFFSKHQDILGIIKPHPREDFSDFYNFIDKRNQNILIIREDLSDKKILYDLLTLSEVIIVMYSTVSIEALFFKKPVISLDYTGFKNLLPIVDGKTVFQCKTFKSFELKLMSLINNKVKINENQIITNTGFLDGKNYQRIAHLIRTCLKI